MHADHKKFLEKQYRVKDWRGRSKHGRRVLKRFSLEGAEIHGWTLLRASRDDRADPPALHSFWRHGESDDAVLRLDIFECASIQAAHDQLLEVLGNMESAAVERRDEKNAPGDVAFGANTMLLFARANLVALVRNAGRTVVPVSAFAREIDALLLEQLESERPRKREN